MHKKCKNLWMSPNRESGKKKKKKKKVAWDLQNELIIGP
jgi:hypothetical protein